MEWLITLIGSIVSVVTSVSMLAYWLGKKFTEIDLRFRQIDEKFKHIDERFRQIDERFEEIDKRFESICRRIEELKSEVKRDALSITSLIRALHGGLLDFMTMKGLFTVQERDYLLKEGERLMEIYLTSFKTNPLRPEDAKFVLEVFREIREKDPKEVDLNKLDRVMEIADKWLWEDGCYEAAKLWFIAYLLKRILQRERGEF